MNDFFNHSLNAYCKKGIGLKKYIYGLKSANKFKSQNINLLLAVHYSEIG